MTVSAIMDFTEALKEVVYADEEAVFLEHMMLQLINAVRATSGISRLHKKHRMKHLQSELKRVTSRLQEPDLLINLMDEYSTYKFYST
jgi:hypothetical protein